LRPLADDGEPLATDSSQIPVGGHGGYVPRSTETFGLQTGAQRDPKFWLKTHKKPLDINARAPKD